jgi:hypothetical protein
MTTSLSRSDILPELQAAHRQFEQWRRVRHPGDRIPDRLWRLAVAAARRLGVSRTARMLHLESQKQASGGGGEPGVAGGPRVCGAARTASR